MTWLTTLSKFAGLFNRLLDKWEQYDAKRQQQRRQVRRNSVKDDPDRAFVELFGEPDGVPNRTSEKSAALRPDTARAPVEPDR